MNQLMRIEFQPEQVELIKKQIAPEATDNELKLFLYQAQRTGLDPLARQIYAVHRKSGTTSKMTIQVSIDGFRVIAERSGDYAGQDEPVFETDDNGAVIKATVKVYRFRGDIRYCAAVGVAYWNEYVPLQDEYKNNQKTGKKVPGAMWQKMPHTMLAKVAEALALRKAYPQDLSGLYTNDEMNQADVKDEPSFDDVVSEEDRQILISMVYNSTLDDAAKEITLEKIALCANYKQYQLYMNKLEDVQKGYDDVTNPNATDAKKIVKKIVGPKPEMV